MDKNEESQKKKVSANRRTASGRPVINDLGKHAKRIRAFRMEANLNQAQLAEKLGVSASAVHNWETGSTRPDIDTLIKMCAVFSTTADALLDITDHGKRPSPQEELFLEAYRGLSPHDRYLIDHLIDKMHEDEFTEFKRTYKLNFKHRRLSPLSACAGTGVDLSSGGFPGTLLLRNIDETRDCDEIISIVGDSMEPDFHSGDRVMVEHMASINEGEVGIFVVAGEGMIKVFKRDGLHSLNPAYKTIHPSEDDNPQCVGRVIGILTNDMLPTKHEQSMIDEINAER